MLSGNDKQNKVINGKLLAKKFIDAQWIRTFILYKKGKISVDILISVMGTSNVVDKEIIEEYGMKVFLSTYKEDSKVKVFLSAFSKDKGWFLNE